MSCPCRTAPWRSFLQGLAQVHKLDTAGLPSASLAADLSRSSRSTLSPVPAGQARRIHTSGRLGRSDDYLYSPFPKQRDDGASFGASRRKPIADQDAKFRQPRNESRKQPRKRNKFDANSKGFSAAGQASSRGSKSRPRRSERGDKDEIEALIRGDSAVKSSQRIAKPPTPSKAEAEAKAPAVTAAATVGNPTLTKTLSVKQVQEILRSIETSEDDGKAAEQLVDNTPGISSETNVAGPSPTTTKPINAENEDPKPTYQPDKSQWEDWRVQKEKLRQKFPEGWNPRKKLSPDALAGIRALNAQFPDVYTTTALAAKFEVSPEAIRRILKSKWQPSVEEEQRRQERWFGRGMQIWERKAELGMKPPKRWRDEGIRRDPSFHEYRKRAAQRERDIEEEEVRKYREELAARREGGAGREGA